MEVQVFTRAVKTLVPRTTRRVFAANISALWLSAICLYTGRNNCHKGQRNLSENQTICYGLTAPFIFTLKTRHSSPTLRIHCCNTASWNNTRHLSLISRCLLRKQNSSKTDDANEIRCVSENDILSYSWQRLTNRPPAMIPQMAITALIAAIPSASAISLNPTCQFRYFLGFRHFPWSITHTMSWLYSAHE